MTAPGISAEVVGKIPSLGRRAQEFACERIARFARGGYLRTELGDVLEEFALQEAALSPVQEMLEALWQYRDDLRFPPTGESIQRRLERVEAVIAKATKP